jgi:exopolysaccharide biosynthesis polyprenyl glycosylphosphotransferase
MPLTINRRYAYSAFMLFTAAIDAGILYAGAYLAALVRLRMGDEAITTRNMSDIADALPFVCAVGLVLLYAQGLYTRPERSAFDVIYSVLASVSFIAVVTMAMSFLMRAFAYPRSVVATGAVAQAIALSLWRMAALWIGRKLYGRNTVLLVGEETETRRMAKKVQHSNARLYEVKYIADAGKDKKTLRKQIRDVDYVFICPGVAEEEQQAIFSYCMTHDTGIFMVPDLFEISIKNASLHTFDDTLAFHVSQLALTKGQQAAKRLFDLAFSLLVIVLLSPLMLLIALVVRFTSPGPVVYKQERVTKDNKVFHIYKFRTMYEGAESETGPVIACESDSRVTSVGTLLRATRLDELLQFINVLTGDMSIVGPRPERPFFIERFTKEHPDYDYRATVKSGITGYAQLMGKYATSAPDKLRFDLWYIKNYSLWLDVTLILMTVKVLFMKGSVS